VCVCVCVCVINWGRVLDFNNRPRESIARRLLRTRQQRRRRRHRRSLPSRQQHYKLHIYIKRFCNVYNDNMYRLYYIHMICTRQKHISGHYRFDAQSFVTIPPLQRHCSINACILYTRMTIVNDSDGWESSDEHNTILYYIRRRCTYGARWARVNGIVVY